MSRIEKILEFIIAVIATNGLLYLIFIAQENNKMNNLKRTYRLEIMQHYNQDKIYKINNKK